MVNNCKNRGDHLAAVHGNDTASRSNPAQPHLLLFNTTELAPGGCYYHYAARYGPQGNLHERAEIAASIVNAVSHDVSARGLWREDSGWEWMPEQEAIHRMMQHLGVVAGPVGHPYSHDASKKKPCFYPSRVHYERNGKSKQLLMCIVIGLGMPGCDFRKSPFKDVKRNKLEFKPSLKQLQQEMKRRFHILHYVPIVEQPLRTITQLADFLMVHPITDDVDYFAKEISAYAAMVQARVSSYGKRGRDRTTHETAQAAVPNHGQFHQDLEGNLLGIDCTTPSQRLCRGEELLVDNTHHEQAFRVTNKTLVLANHSVKEKRNRASGDRTLLRVHQELLEETCDQLRDAVVSFVQCKEVQRLALEKAKIRVLLDDVCEMTQEVHRLEETLSIGSFHQLAVAAAAAASLEQQPSMVSTTVSPQSQTAIPKEHEEHLGQACSVLQNLVSRFINRHVFDIQSTAIQKEKIKVQADYVYQRILQLLHQPAIG